MVRAIGVAGVLMALGIGVIVSPIPGGAGQGSGCTVRVPPGRGRPGEVPGVVAMVVGRDRVLYHGAFGKQDVARDVTCSRTPSSASRR